jgi:GntR family transcriptional regulator
MNSGTQTAYRVLAADLRAALLGRQFEDGSALPTEAELAKQYNVSRQTVRRAFQDLVAEGIVYRVPGRGTFATQPKGQYLRHFGSVEELMGLSLDTELVLVDPLTLEVDVAAASRLRQETDVVGHVTFLRRSRGEVFCVTSTYLPSSLVPLLSDVEDLHEAGRVSRVTIIGLLDARMQSPIASAEQSITATTAEGEVARSLGCDPGRSLLRIDRLYFDDSGAPVELAVSHFLPNHYSYRVTLQRSV